MKWSDFQTGLGRPVFYQPEMSHITGAVTAGLFICNLVQWTGKQKDPDGWIYKTQEEFTQETGLTRREQETARRILKERGFLSEDRRGIPSRVFYRVNLDALNDAVEAHLTSYDGGNRHRVASETAAVERTEPPSYPLTEITSEITHEPVRPTEAEINRRREEIRARTLTPKQQAAKMSSGKGRMR